MKKTKLITIVTSLCFFGSIYAQDQIVNGNLNVNGDANAGSVILSGSLNSTPSAETSRFSKFGFIGNRNSIYVTNAKSGGNIVFGTGAAHASANKMIIDLNNTTFNTNAILQNGYYLRTNLLKGFSYQNESFLNLDDDQTNGANMVSLGSVDRINYMADTNGNNSGLMHSWYTGTKDIDNARLLMNLNSNGDLKVSEDIHVGSNNSDISYLWLNRGTKKNKIYTPTDNTNAQLTIQGGNYTHQVNFKDSYVSSSLGNYATLKGGYNFNSQLILTNREIASPYNITNESSYRADGATISGGLNLTGTFEFSSTTDKYLRVNDGHNIIIGNKNGGYTKVGGTSSSSIVEAFNNHLVLQTARDNDNIYLKTGVAKNNAVTITNNDFIVNNPGIDFNVRMEGVSDTHAFFLDAGNSRIGIGTSSPNSKVDIKASGDGAELLRLSTERPWVFKQTGIGESTGLDLHSTISGKRLTITSNNNNRSAEFYVSDYSSNNKVILVPDGGNVGIGTDTTGNHRLAVEGSIGAREIKVEAIGWSDFVFYKDYNLPTLAEVEQHINEKGHLQDIPSAEEVEKNGIFLGEMNAKLLQKIEELMIYTIQQQKELEEEKKKNNSLELRLNKLERLIKKRLE